MFKTPTKVLKIYRAKTTDKNWIRARAESEASDLTLKAQGCLAISQQNNVTDVIWKADSTCEILKLRGQCNCKNNLAHSKCGTCSVGTTATKKIEELMK